MVFDMGEQGVLCSRAKLPGFVDPPFGVQEADTAVIMRDGDHLLAQPARELDGRFQEISLQFSSLTTKTLGAIHV